MKTLFARGTRAWAIFAQAVVALVGLVSATMIARLLGPADFGIYFAAFTVAAIVGIILDSCVAQAILTKTPGYSYLWRSWRRNSLWISAIGALAVAVVATPLVGSSELVLTCWMLALSIPLTVASMVPRAFLLGSGELRAVAGIDAFAAVAASIVSVLLVLNTGSVAGAASSSILLAGIRLVMLEFCCKSVLPSHEEFLASKIEAGWGHYWKQISGTYQSQLFNFLSRTADNLLISAILGPVSLAQYSRAFSFAIGPVQQAQMALTPTAIRDFAQSTGDEATRVLKLASRTLCVLLPTTAMISVMGPELIPIVLGQGWDSAGNLMLLSTGLAASSILAMPARWLLVSRRDNRSLRIDSYLQLGLLASIGLGAALGGLPAAMIAGSFFAAPLSVVVLWRLAGTEIFGIFVRKMLPLCIYLLAAVGASAAFILWLGPGGLWSIIMALAAAVLITVASFLLVERSARSRV